MRLAGSKKRGIDQIPLNQDLHFVDERGSMAVVKDVLYINGKRAAEGSYGVVLDDGEIILSVGKNGKIKTKGAKKRA